MVRIFKRLVRISKGLSPSSPLIPAVSNGDAAAVTGPWRAADHCGRCGEGTDDFEGVLTPRVVAGGPVEGRGGFNGDSYLRRLGSWHLDAWEGSGRWSWGSEGRPTPPEYYLRAFEALLRGLVSLV